MRHIGNLPDEQQARLFGDFLVARGVRNEMERDAPGSWSVWIVDEDQVASAQRWLEEFRANPTGKEFLSDASKAAEVREAEEKALAEYRKRIRTRRSVFPRSGGYGVGALTFGLVLICIVVAIFSNSGKDLNYLRYLLVTDPTREAGGLLPEIFSGEVWRLFTPMFIHFGWVHLLFNMLWLFQLGSMIEGRQGTWLLAVMVFGTEIVTVIAQYFVSGPFFGGMSGVIYGLAGYVWMRGKYDRASGLFLDPRSVTILLVWLVLCYSGWMGPVANTSHLVGLVVGVVWGRISALLASNRPE